VPAATNITLTRKIGNTLFSNVPTIVFPNPAGAVVTSNGATCTTVMPGAPCDPANGLMVNNSDCGGGACNNFRGEAPGQNVTLDDTLGSRVGNPASQVGVVDGFYLDDTTSLIVFMVDDGSPAFGLSATGFAVTGTCSNNANQSCSIDMDCVGGTCTNALSSRDVLNTTGDVDNNQFLPTPTKTPTNK